MILNALGFIALLWTPRLFDSAPPLDAAPAEPQFPVYDSGLRDLKGAYFANAPVRMIDGLVLDDSQLGQYENHNLLRDRILRVREGCGGAKRNGPVQLVQLPDGIVNGATPIGVIPGQVSGFVVFRLDVIAE